MGKINRKGDQRKGGVLIEDSSCVKYRVTYFLNHTFGAYNFIYKTRLGLENARN